MEQEPIMIYWLAGGIIMILTEIASPGIGLLFAGCGALTVGMLLNLSLISSDDTLLQAVLFLAATAAWAAALWKPMKKLKLGKKKESYSNIIGETAIVGKKGLTKMHGGEVIWSGTIMKAKLAENSDIEHLESGAEVIVKNVMGSTFIVTPKNLEG